MREAMREAMKEAMREAMRSGTASHRHPTIPPPTAQPDQQRAYIAEVERLWAEGGSDRLYAEGGFDDIPGKTLSPSVTTKLQYLVFFNLACLCLFMISVCYLAIRTCFCPEIDYVALSAVVAFYAAPRWIVNPVWARIFMPDVELVIDLP